MGLSYCCLSDDFSSPLLAAFLCILRGCLSWVTKVMHFLASSLARRRLWEVEWEEKPCFFPPISFFLLSHWVSCWTSWLGLQPFLPACSLPCSSSSSSKKARAIPETDWRSSYYCIFVTTSFSRAIFSPGFCFLFPRLFLNNPFSS